MNKKDSGLLVVGICMVLVLVLAIIGWVFNLIAIFHSDFSHVTGELIVRILGVGIAPIGAVAGWL